MTTPKWIAVGVCYPGEEGIFPAIVPAFMPLPARVIMRSVRLFDSRKAADAWLAAPGNDPEDGGPGWIATRP